MLESYKWMGWVWDGMGMGWKSLRGVILRAPLCGAKKTGHKSGRDTSKIKRTWDVLESDGSPPNAQIFDKVHLISRTVKEHWLFVKICLTEKS